MRKSNLGTEERTGRGPKLGVADIWVVVKIRVPFWDPIIVRHPLFRVPKKGTPILTATHMEA